MTTQNTRIVKRLESGRSITPRYAESVFRVVNLRARINELRNEGYDIVTLRTRNRGTEYKFKHLF
jgi:hypothetical protein